MFKLAGVKAPLSVHEGRHLDFIQSVLLRMYDKENEKNWDSGYNLTLSLFKVESILLISLNHYVVLDKKFKSEFNRISYIHY